MEPLRTTATMVEKMRAEAKAVSRSSSQPLQHCQDLVAHKHGYRDWRHVTLSQSQQTQSEATTSHPLLRVSVYWFENFRKRGQETLTVSLRRPIVALLGPSQDLVTHLGARLVMVAPDHLATTNVSLFHEQEMARVEVARAVRMLQFMDVTGLRRYFPGPDSLHERISAPRMPWLDHSTSWVDDATGKTLIANEPYESSARSNHSRLTTWCRLNRHEVACPAGFSMYYPDRAVLQLISHIDYGIPLEPLLAPLSRTQPLVLDHDPWIGESGPCLTPSMAHTRFIERSVAASISDPRPSIEANEASVLMKRARARVAKK